MTMPIKINEKTNINTKKWVKCRYKPKNPYTKWLNIQLSEHDIGNRSLSKESEIEKKKNCLYNIIMSSEHFWFYHDILFSCRIFFSPYVLLSIPSPSPFCPIISIIVLWALNPMCSAQNNNNNINNSQTSTKWFDATAHSRRAWNGFPGQSYWQCHSYSTIQHIFYDSPSESYIIAIKHRIDAPKTPSWWFHDQMRSLAVSEWM